MLIFWESQLGYKVRARVKFVLSYIAKKKFFEEVK